MRCDRCGRDAERIDENGRCETCHLALGRLAATPMEHLEEFVAGAIEHGLTAAQMRAALDMSIRDTSGALPGMPVRREPDGGWARGIWLEPDSIFDAPPPPGGGNRLRMLRHVAGASMEDTARRAGVPVATLALWEQGVLPFDDELAAAARLSELFDCAPSYVFGPDGDAC